MPIAVPKNEEIQQVVDSLISNLNQELWRVNHEVRIQHTSKALPPDSILQIWSNPEIAYTEHKAHDTICDFLEAQGFSVTRHAYGVDTAFEARYGSGGRIVNFNAEYDALPDIGHACGHNLIATSSLTAFLALSHALKVFGLPGRTHLLGTPAEESGGGKVKLIEAGAYEGISASLMALVS
jgi:metal-dependent amidase/aminoacylase/carboxypeptidase family protein